MRITTIWGVLISCLLASCHSSQDKFRDTIVEWKNKRIIFPDSMNFVNIGKDTFVCKGNSCFTILSYIDSIGCVSCKLNLSEWEKLINELKMDDVDLLLCFDVKNMNDIYYLLRRDSFDIPVWRDTQGKLNKLNHFPADPTIQTFLLDKDNRVLAVGNPVHNPKVKELYLKIIRGENVSQEEETPRKQTTVEADRTEADMGCFDWREKQTAEFVLKNTGDSPLVILDTHTSCGCTQAEYDERPVLPGDSLVLRVTYKADQPGYFRKSVLVRSNVEQELLKLTVTGEAVD